MNAIGAISAISGVTPVSGAYGVTGIGSASPISGASTINGSGAVDGTSSGGAPGDSFLNSLSSAFGELNSQMTAADSAANDFAAGGSADLHTVMLELQQASIGLKTGIAVRDKLLEAYQEIMRLQL
jgi:flagellar hook-basal body complex protein FliE